MFFNSYSLSKLFASLMLLSVILFTLSGCEEQNAATETVTTPLEYRIIENGIEIIGEKKNADYAAFYIPPEMVNHYGYNQLEKDEKKVYDAAKVDIGNFTEKVFYDPSIDGAKYSKLLDLLRIEELSYTHLISKQTGDFVASEAKYEIVFTYDLSPEEMTRRNIESEKAAFSIISEMPRGLSDYEKVKYFHDYLILNVDKNTTDYDALTIYGTLIRGIANCEGYTRTFSYLCNISGIENLIMTGLTDTRHMWNMVKLGGNWYHIDVTFDEPDEILSKQYPDFVSYQHFLVGDELILNDRIVWTNLLTAPAANAINENYFVKENKLIENDESAKEVIENALAEAISKNKSSVSVKCASTDVYLRTVERLSDDFESIYKSLEQKTDVKADFSTSNVYGNYRIICFFIEYS